MPLGQKRPPLDLAELVSTLPDEKRQLVDRIHTRRPAPFFPDALGYTEGKREWVALWEHCKLGQINPGDLRRMDDLDLEFMIVGSKANGTA